MKKWILVLMVVSLSMLGAFGGGSSESVGPSGEKTFNIDLATAYAADGPVGIALEKFVADVKKASDGTLNIHLFTDGTIGNPKDNYLSLANGDLDMAVTGLEGLDLYAPEFTFLDSPFFINSLEHQEALLASDIGEALKNRYRENGIETLAWHNRDIRVLASNRKVVKPSDVVGLKLRLPGMQVYVDGWGYLKVSTTTVAMGELYTALQTRVAEACEGGYEQMTTLKVYEVQKYIADSNHVFEFVGLFINTKLYAKLSERQREILRDEGVKAMNYANELGQNMTASFKQECLDKGMELVDIDRNAFRAAMLPYYETMFKTKWTLYPYEEIMKYAK